jgi:hypothetical protein
MPIEYQKIKSRLLIEFESYPIDLLASGLINLGLNSIINKVALQMLPPEIAERAKAFYYNRSFYYPSVARFSDPVLIEAEVTDVEKGSWREMMRWESRRLSTIRIRSPFLKILRLTRFGLSAAIPLGLSARASKAGYRSRPPPEST